jgi:hypothetical protein
MPNQVAPETHIEIGKRDRLELSFRLPELSKAELVSGPNLILSLSDGYFGMVVRGVNPLRLARKPKGADSWRKHFTPVSLTMILEWILYDRIYALENEVERSLAEVVGGESTPDVRFRRSNGDVEITWDLKGVRRHGTPYGIPKRRTLVKYEDFLNCLKDLTDAIISALENRAAILGCLDVWKRWLDGYRPERNRFVRFMHVARTRETAVA